MNVNILGVINLGEREDHIRELTPHRPLAAVPFGGRYRLVDFMLSNFVNSGIDDVAVILKDKYHSINDHISHGKDWDLDRRTGGLRMLYPDVSDGPSLSSGGDLPIIQRNMNFFVRNKKDHVLLVRSNYIGNIDFNSPIEDHIESGRDITVLTRTVEEGRNRMELLGLDIILPDDGKVRIGTNVGQHDSYDLSIEMYILKKEVFLDIISRAIEDGSETYLKRIIVRELANYNVGKYVIPSDIMPIQSLQNYYNASMRILDEDYQKYLFYENGKIYTKVKDAPSTLYLGDTEVNNSFIANGCIIEGTVENSIIFRNVHIKKGAVVLNSIIFQDSVIGERSSINYCILDKKVEIGNERVLMGDGGSPYVIKKGAVIR